MDLVLNAGYDRAERAVQTENDAHKSWIDSGSSISYTNQNNQEDTRYRPDINKNYRYIIKSTCSCDSIKQEEWPVPRMML